MKLMSLLAMQAPVTRTTITSWAAPTATITTTTTATTTLSVNDAVLNKSSAAPGAKYHEKSKRECAYTHTHTHTVTQSLYNLCICVYVYAFIYVHISFQFPFGLRVFLAYLIMVFGQQQQQQQQHKERGWALDVAGHQSLMRTARHSKPTHSHTHTPHTATLQTHTQLNNRAGRRLSCSAAEESPSPLSTIHSSSGATPLLSLSC